MFLFCSNRVKQIQVRQSAKRCGSGDDVGRDLVFDEGDTVAQQQLAFLQPL
jgi:hypothetical protein